MKYLCAPPILRGKNVNHTNNISEPYIYSENIITKCFQRKILPSAAHDRPQYCHLVDNDPNDLMINICGIVSSTLPFKTSYL